MPQFAQSQLQEQLDYAKKLAGEEQFYDAVTELKRLLFFDESHRFSFEANSLIGDCYKNGAKLNDAIKFYTIAQRFAPDDSSLCRLKLGVIRCNILRRTPEQALSLLSQLENDGKFKNNSNDISYWKAWSYMFSDEWEKASLEFGKIDPVHPLKKLSDQVIKDKYSVSFAKVISYILPGFGQFYTKNYLSGLMSIAWTGLFGYLAINAFSAERIFDGFVMTGLFFRFYQGNVQNAENFAVQKNTEISNKALFFIQKNYEGLKP